MKKTFCLLFSAAFLLITWQCQPETHQIENLNGNVIGVIGHGGSGLTSLNNPYPENSYTSIVHALFAYDADGVEVDVQLSHDQDLMLYHDLHLESSTSCTGCIFQYTAEELCNCEFHNSNTIGGEKLIRLSKITQLLRESGSKKMVFLDVRAFPTCDESTMKFGEYQAILAARISEAMNDKVHKELMSAESDNLILLDELKRLQPSAHLFLDCKISDEKIAIAKAHGFFGLVCYNNETSKEDISKAHSQNLRVVLFDVRSRASTIDAISKNPDFIQTDNIPMLQQLLY